MNICLISVTPPPLPLLLYKILYDFVLTFFLGVGSGTKILYKPVYVPLSGLWWKVLGRKCVYQQQCILGVCIFCVLCVCIVCILCILCILCIMCILCILCILCIPCILCILCSLCILCIAAVYSGSLYK